MRKTNRWQKLNYLVPDPKCRMDEDSNSVLQITKWTDTRTQPTDNQIDAVVDQQVADSALDNEADKSINTSKKDKLLFEINFDRENRLRVLEGKLSITKAQYKDTLKTVYKNL